MDIHIPKSFQREAKKAGISDEDCRAVIEKAERGLIDADLGGRLIKQRIPRGALSAARGSRAVVFYRRGKLAVFLHLFSKSAKANLTDSESAEYLELARFLDRLTDAELHALGEQRGWRKIEL
ncbi:type II toxin-antitoxin system RelE/ParE family toxin [Methylosinus sp. Sm6]|uniref:type II toxin-antitoxin system RelE/ParE family toxin n=1 Tax=Methylosinus sp. Sm6 TaxID=2866948 RepID=UPI001C98F97C|nr:type II toxin-antitoxin system RelE/ParE family toxin [Methylosinus sp. Sm6]MBY6242764.1 type II toxin-antitoxin system RelE/ParE family toxin [Methylosinus sp. Sm6]